MALYSVSWGLFVTPLILYQLYHFLFFILINTIIIIIYYYFLSLTLGPSKPFVPIRITAGNIDHSRAVIQWTVPSIAYSPESYFIRYGTSRNHLTYKSATLIGSQDLNARDQTLTIMLKYLIHDTQYYYQVVSTNTYDETTSVVYSFRTTKLGKDYYYCF